MKIPNLLVIISLITFISIILTTASPFKTSTNSFEINEFFYPMNKVQLAIAQDDGGGDDGGGDDGGGDDF